MEWQQQAPEIQEFVKSESRRNANTAKLGGYRLQSFELCVSQTKYHTLTRLIKILTCE
jgi:hypothetical protein